MQLVNHRRQISYVEQINFYSSWNHQKTYGSVPERSVSDRSSSENFKKFLFLKIKKVMYVYINQIRCVVWWPLLSLWIKSVNCHCFLSNLSFPNDREEWKKTIEKQVAETVKKDRSTYLCSCIYISSIIKWSFNLLLLMIYFQNPSGIVISLYKGIFFMLQNFLLRKKDLVMLHKKMKFSIKDFFSKCDQIRRKQRIWSHLLKRSLMEDFIFCAV